MEHKEDVWIAVVESTGEVIGAWVDKFITNHAAAVYEEEQKKNCVVVLGVLSFEL